MAGIDLSYVRSEYALPHPQSLHVEEGVTTFGRKDATGVPRLYVEIKDETGAVVYSTWQNGPLGQWRRATLYLGRFSQDAAGEEIGFSLWD